MRIKGTFDHGGVRVVAMELGWRGPHWQRCHSVSFGNKLVMTGPSDDG